MKIKNIFLSVAVLGHIGINAADNTISLENKTVSELIEQMQQAKAEDRYKYMNAIKMKIGKINEEKREEKIKEIQKEIEAKKEELAKNRSQATKNHSKSVTKDTRQSVKGMDNDMGFGGGIGVGGMGSENGIGGNGMGAGGHGGAGGGHGGGW